MNAYLDASVILRIVFGEKGRLAEWSRIGLAVSSEIVRVECLRTVDRMRIRVPLDDDEVAARRQALCDVFDRMDLVALSPPVLERASQPFPTLLGTIDAIHLSSALLWRQSGESLTLCTHDVELARAARAMGFATIGCE